MGFSEIIVFSSAHNVDHRLIGWYRSQIRKGQIENNTVFALTISNNT